ncbi:MAG: FeoA family protein [Fibrobacterota bacterium]
MKLKDLSPGDCGVIRGYENADKKYLSKLMSMGVTRGTSFRVIKRAPLGDPVQIEIRGFRLSLRKNEADILMIGASNE